MKINSGMMLLVGALTLLVGYGQSRGQQPNKVVNKNKTKKPAKKDTSFTWDYGETLVFYALDSENEEPRPGTPSLVMKDFMKLDKKNRVFLSDWAPYISVTTLDDFEQTALKSKAAGGLSKEIVARLDRIVAWLKKSGKNCVGFQIEPSNIAGDGTARAKGLKAE